MKIIRIIIVRDANMFLKQHGTLTSLVTIENLMRVYFNALYSMKVMKSTVQDAHFAVFNEIKMLSLVELKTLKDETDTSDLLIRKIPTHVSSNLCYDCRSGEIQSCQTSSVRFDT